VIQRVPKLAKQAAGPKEELQSKLIEHRAYTRQHGEDMPEVKDWRWKGK
jgi:xylulose-5-phosphate/fructose-6-phosphate phosphoketolase